MTSISTIGLQQILLSGFQRAQGAAQESQIQLATGDVSNTYSGVGPQTARLLSAEGVVTRASAFEDAANAAVSRLQIQEAALTDIGDAVTDLRQTFVAALANGSGDVLLPDVETAAQRVLSSLNAQFGGTFVFGGTDGSAPPVDASSLADIGGAANIADLFSEGERARLAVEAGTTVDGGALASDIASELLGELAGFFQATSALGPFAGPLTADQRDFLVQQVARFDEISDDIITEQGLNGVSQAQALAANVRNVQARDLAEIVASDIEDADLAEVVARLNQDQLAIQASAQALAQASQLSLLNFI